MNAPNCDRERKMGYKVMQIEASNECSLACAYCPHPSQARPKGIMEMDTFKKCMELVRRSANPELGGRKFVHLNHFGEPLLNPRLPDFIRYASSQNIEVSFSTNAVDAEKKLFPRSLWRELADAGSQGRHRLLSRQVGANGSKPYGRFGQDLLRL